MQSRLASAFEALTNVIVGYFVAVAANFAVLPFFGFDVSASDGFLIGLIFTIISLVRSYLLRRLFNSISS